MATLISAGEAARNLGVTTKALEMKRRKNVGPPFIRDNNRPYYHPDMLKVGSYAVGGEVENFEQAALPPPASPTSAPTTAPPESTELTVDRVSELFDEWERKEIEQARSDYFKGKVAPLDWAQKHARSEDLYKLQQSNAADLLAPKFKAELIKVLGLQPGDPILDHKQVHFWFRQTWLAIERARDRFAGGDFS